MRGGKDLALALTRPLADRSPFEGTPAKSSRETAVTVKGVPVGRYNPSLVVTACRGGESYATRAATIAT